MNLYLSELQTIERLLKYEIARTKVDGNHTNDLTNALAKISDEIGRLDSYKNSK